MKIIIQRTKQASVSVEGTLVGSIRFGIMVLVGITHDDTIDDVNYLVEKVVNLRIFEDEGGKMNLSLLDVKGQILSISQFTLYGDCRKGRRPNFMAAAKPAFAQELYQEFNKRLREKGLIVETGRFGEMMDVQLTNNGPVTLILES